MNNRDTAPETCGPKSVPAAEITGGDRRITQEDLLRRSGAEKPSSGGTAAPCRETPFDLGILA
ncbi:hypothetical protein GCM10014719_18310 [Planomonospora parontospora subsp. antibiotica]|nr:hypothetical protein GCM10014719_18310 [Planomonospora parontospora subsp. antibiotica]GII15358.1 hypothetical protein Ppa05_20840 [Planomonospora parontospora subsp. antibiotica]